MEDELMNIESKNDDIFESEDIGEDNDVDTHPFDPTQINIITKQDTLINLIQRLEHGEFNLNPPYQRNLDLWRPLQQSRLIESNRS